MAGEAEVNRVGIALARLDAAAQSEGIEPGSYLGGWVAAQRDLVEALYGLEQNRAEQMQGALTMAKATTEAGAETMRLQVEAMASPLVAAAGGLDSSQRWCGHTPGPGRCRQCQGSSGAPLWRPRTRRLGQRRHGSRLHLPRIQ